MVETLLLQKTDKAVLRVVIDKTSGKRTAVCDGFSKDCNSCQCLGVWTCPENNLQPPCIAEALAHIENNDYPVSTENRYP